MEEPKSYQLALEWVGIEDVPIQFSNQMLVQHVNNEFVLTFGYMTPPVFLNPTNEEEIASIEDVPIKPIARLGMTPDRMLELIKALQENYRNYQAGIAGRQGLGN
ncbi:MAG: hypothetical protein OXH22_08235 [Chloroflexi bacterium]|nr:hypothetical protein [Chloroflexota bacterium]